MGGVVLFATVNPDVMKRIKESGLLQELHPDHFCATTKEALKHALLHSKRLHRQSEVVTPEELAKYDLSDIVADDLAKTTTSNDSDPVEEILHSVGVDTVNKVGEISKNIMKNSTDNVVKAGRIGKHIVKRGSHHVGKIGKHIKNTPRKIVHHIKRVKKR
jgi:predicted ATP-dependent Lon-type protease